MAASSQPTPGTRGKLILVVSEDRFFLTHRLPLALAALANGYEVLLAARFTGYRDQIERQGIRTVEMPMSRRSVNPLREFATVAWLYRLYRRERPLLVHHVAIKPVLYGSIAARLAGVAGVVNALTGLGHIFIADTLKARTLRLALRPLFRGLLNARNGRLILQNSDDETLLTSAIGIRPETICLIRGAGVDLHEFPVTPMPVGPAVVVLPARMLWEKGVGEFVEAARLLKRDGHAVRCVLVGPVDKGNPAAIQQRQLEQWVEEGVVEWWGHREEMPAVYAESHIVCLPSYREGLPKVLLEAAACSRPLVATDVPGCREIVVHGHNGYLVPAREAHALAQALAKLIETPALAASMGLEGRRLVEREFSVQKVIAATLAVYDDCLDCS